MTQPLVGDGSGSCVLSSRREDVQLCVTSTYNVNAAGTSLTGFQPLEADPIVRANYYLAGMAAQFFVSGGQTAVYNSIVNVVPDGAISQVTWRIDPSPGVGAMTVVSSCTEHDLWFPRYPARRRAEHLPPVGAGPLTPTPEDRINVLREPGK